MEDRDENVLSLSLSAATNEAVSRPLITINLDAYLNCHGHWNLSLQHLLHTSIAH